MTDNLSIHPVSTFSKTLAYLMVCSVLLYIFNNYLVYWQGLPGPYNLLVHLGWLGEASSAALADEKINHGWMQLVGYIIVLFFTAVYVIKTNSLSLRQASERLQILAAYLVRVAFWAVMLIGFVDMLISFMRIEKFLEFWISNELIVQLGRPSFRGIYVHYPLLISSFVFALIFRKISFSWLALMVVLSEFQIVLTRFVFSYEQAFQGDLVRFWYAALFLFASAYTLINEGHVRVDVLYAGFSRVKKATANIVGSLFLGIPLCWVILMHGLGGKGNSINSPLLSFEISQSGYGMYVKYLMAGFLVVFAVTMIIQFSSYFLRNMAELIEPENKSPDEAGIPPLTDAALPEGMRKNSATQKRES
jgi:TRAP-type mannitol/chloroaromatic compound transport system permease small subunit